MTDSPYRSMYLGKVARLLPQPRLSRQTRDKGFRYRCPGRYHHLWRGPCKHHHRQTITVRVVRLIVETYINHR